MLAGTREQLRCSIFHLNDVDWLSLSSVNKLKFVGLSDKLYFVELIWGRQASTGACIDLWMHVGLFVGELVNKTCKTQMLIKN